MIKGIIDIGTNTFNLLIVEFFNDKSFNIIHEDKQPVKLGRGSMNDKLLKQDAINRAISALKLYIDKATNLGASSVDAFATSAVRGALNKEEFLSIVEKETGIVINIIQGDREAHLIYKGVMMAVQPPEKEVCLILDIGGGSNEFIICNSKEVFWKKSYDLGMARLLEQINPKDPIGEDDIGNLKKMTDALTCDLSEQVRKYKPKILLGASGSFETYVSMILCDKYGSDDKMKGLTGIEISKEEYESLNKKLVVSSYGERLKMKGLPEWRAEMIVLASVFTTYILEKFEIEKIFFSEYALKEGVVSELVQK